MEHDRIDDYTWGIYLTILWDDTGKGKMGKDKIQLKKVTPPSNCQLSNATPLG
jgi:hypothetical protein